MNKRGGWEISLNEIVFGTVLAFILIFVVAPMLGNLWGGQAKIDTGTRTTIYGINAAVKALIDQNKDACKLPFYIMADTVLAGFDKPPAQYSKVLDDKYWKQSNTLNRPDACRGYSCIVLCKVHDWWGKNDAGKDDCINYRVDFINFGNRIEQLRLDGSYALMIYANNLKSATYITITKLSKANQNYDFNIKFLSTPEDQQLPDCRNLFSQTSINADLKTIISEEQAKTQTP